MDTRSLEKFAQAARRQLTEQVTARLQHVLQGDSADLRAHATALEKLHEAIANSSRAAVIERVAYTWFNRFCALRFMDANRYTPLGIVSPAPGHTQPELLQEAKAGQIDASLPVDTERVLGLLGEHVPSPDPQQEAYRLLLVAACNSYHAAMPFLFEKIDDYSELLLPDDLLSANSVLHGLRLALSEEACQDVEVIGWLYQFYIAEKKDAVFAGLKAGQKIAAADIPAATQLFTPHWIVRFVVENSLGRLWLLNRPQSALGAAMPFYIRPEQEETDFLHVAAPEDLRLCDPAAGSGHMLTYAFDLLYAIYEEEGYNPPDIPRLILQHNLYGVEIDERAGSLAAFALTMKARARDSRFLRRHVRPNICVLKPAAFAAGEVEGTAWAQALERDLLDLPLRDALLADLKAWSLVDTAGSLLRPQLTPLQVAVLRQRIEAAGDLFNQELNERVLGVLGQVEYLARSYHVVVANPPYMGGGGMNEKLAEFARREYPDSKADMFAMFIERNLDLAGHGGLVGMITMQSWMFLSSYEKLRGKLLDRQTLLAMAHLGARAFDSIGGEVVSTTVFVVEQAHHPDLKGSYVRLVEGSSEAEKQAMLSAALTQPLYRASAADFKKIPGAPIAYWVSEQVRNVFQAAKLVQSIAEVKHGLSTGKNEAVVRLWAEVAAADFGRGFSTSTQAVSSGHKWFPYNKGGSFRKWYGNHEFVVRYDPFGIRQMSTFSGHRHDGKEYYFHEGITWTFISSAKFAARYTPNGFVFDVAGSSMFTKDPKIVLAFLCTEMCFEFLKILNPTLNFQVGNLKTLPYLQDALLSSKRILESITTRVIYISKSDWDSYETSWDFTTLPLLRPEHRGPTLAATYTNLRRHWQSMTDEMQRLETENNRIFIDAYGLQDELTPDVPLDEITLTGNPHYRYGAGKSEAEYARLQAADTMRELVSYAVGCMFGRYSLDKPGLILANAGQSLADYLAQVPNPTFLPDKDNVIPILPGDWFADDAPERFKRFLRTAFGDAHFAENLKFVEDSLGRDIRSYFLREFYDHHVRTYQKRPIYWLFSSPKGGFNALVYLHRYRPDTVSIVLNEYLREYAAKLQARRTHLQQLAISVTATPGDKSKAIKEVDGIDKTLVELRAYEDDVLYPLAARQVRLDLDDGVKVNYGKLGKALKRIPGLDA